MERWPTRNGIAIPPTEVWLPRGRKKTNNHHAHFSGRSFSHTLAHTALRDLERHQYALPVDTHEWLHDNYLPPELPTEEQAVREIIDAYDQGEAFKVYNRYARRYIYHEIPLQLVDGLICKYGLAKVFSMAAD